MKFILKLQVVVLLALFSSNVYASDDQLFDLNEEALTEEFSELTQLEEVVMADPSMTIEQAQSLHLITEAFAQSADGFTSDQFLFQWEGFLWGFLCCPIGFFTVAINSNKSHDNKISFWIGVGANTVLSVMYTALVYSPATTY